MTRLLPDWADPFAEIRRDTDYDPPARQKIEQLAEAVFKQADALMEVSLKYEQESLGSRRLDWNQALDMAATLVDNWGEDDE